MEFMNKIIVRCDDWDARIDLATVKSLHGEFVKRGIPMTIAVNNVIGHRIGFDQNVLDYMNKETDPASWDIQLHGFEHSKIWAMKYADVYRDVFANLMMTKRDFIHSNPTMYYPAWNEKCEILEQVCDELGLTIGISSRTTHEFLTWNNIQPVDLYFWHWWTPDDRREIPAVLDKLVQTNLLLKVKPE